MRERGLRTMLRRLRRERGLTQVGLAKKAKVTQAYVAMLERGVKANPSLAIIKRLAKALAVSVEQLLPGGTRVRRMPLFIEVEPDTFSHVKNVLKDEAVKEQAIQTTQQKIDALIAELCVHTEFLKQCGLDPGLRLKHRILKGLKEGTADSGPFQVTVTVRSQ